jgi:hypothetical protein
MNMWRPAAWLLSVAFAGAMLTGCSVLGTSCPSALLTGTLAADGDELVVRQPVGGSIDLEHVRWPAGFRLEHHDGRLVVVDVLGTAKAGEGDHVRLGGGETTAGTWGVCGLVEVDQPAR